jgi:hypothetical protein
MIRSRWQQYSSKGRLNGIVFLTAWVITMLIVNLYIEVVKAISNALE